MMKMLTQFFKYLVYIVLSLLFVFAGKVHSDDIYTVTLFMYLFIILFTETRFAKLERRLKKYKKALAKATLVIETSVRSTEQHRTQIKDMINKNYGGGYVDTNMVDS